MDTFFTLGITVIEPSQVAILKLKPSQFKYSLEDEIERLEDRLDIVISNLVFVAPDDKNNVKVKVYSIGGKYVGDVDGHYQNGRLNYFVDEPTIIKLKQQLKA